MEIRLPEVDGVVGAACFPLFVEEQSLAVRRDVRDEGVVQPGEIPLAGIALQETQSADPGGASRQENAPVPGHVLKFDPSRNADHDADLARRRHRVQRLIRSVSVAVNNSLPKATRETALRVPRLVRVVFCPSGQSKRTVPGRPENRDGP